jgi:4-azaleucine resistance transporter AzlC
VTRASRPNDDRRRSFRAGMRAAIPFGVAVVAFGVSFGLLARVAGFGPWAPIVMSATTFAGSAQFAVVSVLGAGGTVTAAITSALLLNARYAPIGISVGSSLTGSAPARLLQGQLVVDESWALAARPDGRFDRGVLLGAGVVLYASWLLGTTTGVLVGDLVGDPTRFGLDAAFPALFLALLVPQAGARRAAAAALLGALIALVLTPFAPAGVPIVAAAAAALVGVRR